MTAPSFLSLSESWLVDGATDPDIEAELRSRYRTAWQTGESGDRYAVLHFVQDRPRVEGFDLVLEGLRSTEPDVARHAAAIATSLIIKGFDLGPTVADDFGVLTERFPDLGAFGRASLTMLAKRDQS